MYSNKLKVTIKHTRLKLNPKFENSIQWLDSNLNGLNIVRCFSRFSVDAGQQPIEREHPELEVSSKSMRLI